MTDQNRAIPTVVSAQSLEAFATDLFTSAGVSDLQAKLWARSLVWANVRGVDSHGVLRIPRYLDLLASGEIKSDANVQVLMAAGATALLDVDRAPGPVGMCRAMEVALERAHEAHVGWCVARNITHAGAIGYYALQAAEAGMIGLVMTASRPLMAYHGSRDSVLSTNPIAIAVPARERSPLLLDMSTSTVALGKIQHARHAGDTIPKGWGIDANGEATTDPNALATLTPMAGPKGSGLSLMIECLTSLVAGNPVIAPALNGVTGTNMNGVAIAVDVAAFGGSAQFRSEVDALAESIGAQPTDVHTDRLLMPGERSELEAQRRQRDGIPLPKGVWNGLAAAASAASMPMLTPMAG